MPILRPMIRLVLLLTIFLPSVAFAVPDLGDNSDFVCKEKPIKFIKNECFANIFWNRADGSQKKLKLKKARRVANRLIRSLRREVAISSEEEASELEARIESIALVEGDLRLEAWVEIDGVKSGFEFKLVLMFDFMTIKDCFWNSSIYFLIVILLRLIYDTAC